MKRFRILLAVLLLLVFVIGTAHSFADVGDFSGDSDYGGGDYSGGSDWGGSDYSGSDWGDSSDTGGGSGNSRSTGITVFFLLAAFYVLLFLLRMKKQSHRPASTVQPYIGGVDTTLLPISKLVEKDPHFSEPAVCDKISNLYVQMQNAWTAKNWEPMRPHFSDALYNQLKRQLDQYIEKGQTNYVDRIAVLSVTLNGWRTDGQTDSLIARVQTRIVDYVFDDATGSLVRGSTSAEKFMTYEYTLTRSSGVLTPGPDVAAAAQTTCPTCGAVIDVNNTARCPYCRNVLQAATYDWVISNIKGISQQTK